MQTLKTYIFPALLLLAVIGGGLTGYLLGKDAQYLKPFGDIFLNLIFTTVVPLVFFSVSSAIIRAGNSGLLGKIFLYMGLVFVGTGLIAAISALILVKIFPLTDLSLPFSAVDSMKAAGFSNHIAQIFTVPAFAGLLTHQNMLALILFSLLTGIAVIKSAEQGLAFSRFLQSGEAVFMQFFSLIMYYAPIGFFAYFAVLVTELGPQLIHSYVRIFIMYSLFAFVYFTVVYTIYAYVAGRSKGVQLFWQNIWVPAITAVATCSSAASIPANLAATKAMGVSPSIRETVIPLGSLIHKDGSVIGGIFKIAFLFGLFHMDFSGLAVLTTALGISLLVGTVMGAIPGGGMLGELLILNVYGFPPSVLVAVAAISMIIDPLATLLNVTGNTASALLVHKMTTNEWKGYERA